MNSNRIVGRVVVMQTKVGVPDLVVLAHDVDQGAGVVASVSTTTGAGAASFHGLGSVLTDSEGRFELAYTAGESCGRSLVVTILAPDWAGGAREPLFRSQPRPAAGSVESFFVQLDESALHEVAVDVPSELPEAAAFVLRRIDVGAARQVEIAKEVAFRNAERVTTARAVRATVARQVQADLRRRSASLSGAATVQPDESVVAATRAVIAGGLARHFRGKSISGLLALSPEQHKRFRDANGTLRSDIPAQEIEELLFESVPGDGVPLTQFRDNPLLAACRDKTLPEDRCAEDDSGSNESEPRDDVPGTDGSPSVDGTAQALRLLGSMRTPEETLFGVGSPRPSIGDVQGSVNSFELRGGPADT